MRRIKGYNEEAIMSLDIVNEDEETVYLEPFMMVNPKIDCTELPAFDKLYYEYLEKTLEHLLYKYEKGWITSPRQVMYSSDECISGVHFLFNKNNSLTINIFQRSSNIKNIKDDIGFFSYFINKHLSKKYDSIVVNHFVSCPHYFKNKKTKVD